MVCSRCRFDPCACLGGPTDVIHDEVAEVLCEACDAAWSAYAAQRINRTAYEMIEAMHDKALALLGRGHREQGHQE